MCLKINSTSLSLRNNLNDNNRNDIYNLFFHLMLQIFVIIIELSKLFILFYFLNRIFPSSIPMAVLASIVNIKAPIAQIPMVTPISTQVGEYSTILP